VVFVSKSGGELQRMKLASHLGSKGLIFVLNEPANGIHIKDIRHIIGLFDLVEEHGNSIFLIECNWM